jgi:hypothetical protein
MMINREEETNMRVHSSSPALLRSESSRLRRKKSRKKVGGARRDLRFTEAKWLASLALTFSPSRRAGQNLAFAFWLICCLVPVTCVLSVGVVVSVFLELCGIL